jgi:hypothetical protein
MSNKFVPLLIAKCLTIVTTWACNYHAQMATLTQADTVEELAVTGSIKRALELIEW